MGIGFAGFRLGWFRSHDLAGSAAHVSSLFCLCACIEPLCSSQWHPLLQLGVLAGTALIFPLGLAAWSCLVSLLFWCCSTDLPVCHHWPLFDCPGIETCFVLQTVKPYSHLWPLCL